MSQNIPLIETMLVNEELILAFESLRDFMEIGGWVLYVIAGFLVIMWFMIFERIFYILAGHKTARNAACEIWQSRAERNSWEAQQIRLKLISTVSMKLYRHIPLIKTCVALCPLLGLLGTVTGMIDVFQVMGLSGNSNVRGMAGGVSRATIPTMAGMVAALSGLFFSFWLQGYYERERELLAEQLTRDVENNAESTVKTSRRKLVKFSKVEDTKIDITPMLDVVFIMLIFFIVTSSFVKVSGIDVIKPVADNARHKPQASIMVAVDAENRVWIDRRQIDVRAIKTTVLRLQAENPEGEVIIQADESSLTETVMQVVDGLTDAGIIVPTISTVSN